jgi:uncharacterized protein
MSSEDLGPISIVPTSQTTGILRDSSPHRSMSVACVMIALMATCLPADVRADWGVSGAQYSCDAKSHSFELLPHDRSSDDPPEGIPLKDGYSEIPQGARPFRCALGPVSLHVAIEVYPPASHGMGMGDGFVRARSISADGVELLPDSPAFDWSISPSSPPLIRIRVTAVRRGILRVEQCRGQSPSSETCDSREVPFQALADAQAASVRPADLQLQKQESATKVPTELDYANAFVFDNGSGVPVCAHLHSGFIRGMSMVAPTTPTEISRSGRIGGEPGQRVHLRPANPQVCDASIEPSCRAKSYLVPGDRVTIGFICGAWTYIRYLPPTRASDVAYGWVPTRDLYDVDSRISTRSRTTDIDREYWDRRTKDPLILAAADHDASRVRTLLGSNENPDGGDDTLRGFSTPLAIAIRSNDIAIAAALINAGANTNHPAVLSEAVSATAPMWNLLIQSKMKPGALPLKQLAEYERIDYNEDLAELTGKWQPIRDLPGLVRRAIEAGAEVDRADDGGDTPLGGTLKSNNVDVARALLKGGANPNRVQKDGQSILMKAVAWYQNYHDPTMAIALLEGGAAPNFRSEGEYLKPDEDAAPGAFVDAGQTALTLAAEAGYVELVRLLLAHGAQPNLSRSDGASPTDIARAAHHIEAEQLIRRSLAASALPH